MIAQHHTGQERSRRPTLDYWSLASSSQDCPDYLYMGRGILSPGVCLASIVLDNSRLSTSTWQSTTAGIMLQQGAKRIISVANHWFRHSDEVYRPTPSKSFEFRSSYRSGRIAIFKVFFLGGKEVLALNLG